MAVSVESQRSVMALAVPSASGEDTSWFAATQAGLLVSRDAGATWTSGFAGETGLEDVPVTAVAVSPAYEHDRIVLAAIPGGIGRSSDGGRSWRFTRLPLPAPTVTAIVFSPDFGSDGFAFAATLQDGMLRSEDGGQSWEAWNSGLFDPTVQAMVISPRFATDATVIVGTSAGLYRSSNAGRRWQPVGPLAPLPSVLTLAAWSTDGDRVHYLAGTEEHGLWRSDDGGEHWQAHDLPAPRGAIHAIASEHDDWLLLTDEAVFEVADSGENWRPLPDVPLHPAAISALALAGPHMVLGTTDGRILRIPRVRLGTAAHS